MIGSSGNPVSTPVLLVGGPGCGKVVHLSVGASLIQIPDTSRETVKYFAHNKPIIFDPIPILTYKRAGRRNGIEIAVIQPPPDEGAIQAFFERACMRAYMATQQPEPGPTEADVNIALMEG